MRKANVFEDEASLDGGEPPGYATLAARVGATAGGRDLAVKVFVLPPGESLCPYHYEYEEEWLLVLDGTVSVRTPAGSEDLGRGDLVCFEPGPGGAHKVTCAGAETARVMMFSSAREPAVAVYPDSDKIGVWPGNPADKVMLHRRDGAVDYWVGE